MKKIADTKTAAQACRENAKDVHALLDILSREIKRREQDYERAGLNWSHNGTMAFWKERLVELLTSVMGANDEKECHKMIEAALAELRG